LVVLDFGGWILRCEIVSWGAICFFCRIEWMMGFECWRTCLNVGRSVKRWWLLLREVVVEGVVGRGVVFGDGFGVLMEERTIHVYLSIDLRVRLSVLYIYRPIDL
jgi:hypothetical protein